MMFDAISVAVVEDIDAYRLGLERLFSESPNFACWGAFATAEQALERLTDAHQRGAEQMPNQMPDVVLMDIELPGISGIEAVSRLHESFPELPVAMLTIVETNAAVLEALQAGALGYLIKATPAPKLLESVRELSNGGSPMSAHIARKVISLLAAPTVAPAIASIAPAASPQHSFSAISDELQTLTPREREILTLLADGYLYKEVAAALGISLSTVQTFIRSIYKKLHINTRSEALLKAHSLRR
jgi:DNA-binding NarL/FixJ family response regulator